MSDSVRPHRRQPNKLPRPWDSPGKNTGVGCCFLFQCMKVKSESEVAQLCPTLCDPPGLQPTRLLHPWEFPGKSAGVGCHCLPDTFPWPTLNPLPISHPILPNRIANCVWSTPSLFPLSLVEDLSAARWNNLNANLILGSVPCLKPFLPPFTYRKSLSHWA